MPQRMRAFCHTWVSATAPEVALERHDAEHAWLGGEDVFAQIRRDPHDVFQDPPVPQRMQLAFG
jgi:hypothetical protein